MVKTTSSDATPGTGSGSDASGESRAGRVEVVRETNAVMKVRAPRIFPFRRYLGGVCES